MALLRIDILTLFTDIVDVYCSDSIIGRAASRGIIDIRSHNIRDYTLDKHKRVDDSPFGGGPGMLMQAQPINDCYAALVEENGGTHIPLIFMSAQGQVLTQKKAVELSKLDRFAILCGRYEGVDERVIEKLVDEEISIGDYVVTGGELPALILADAVSRMVPGVLSSEEGFTQESHYGGLLEYPQYTRPAEWEGREVPPVLLSGHHANIIRWQREQALRRTLERRPDMLEGAELSKEDRRFLRSLEEKKDGET